jgi:hypothetical protein
VEREYERKPFGHLAQRFQQNPQGLDVVDVCWAMQGQEGEPPFSAIAELRDGSQFSEDSARWRRSLEEFQK